MSKTTEPRMIRGWMENGAWSLGPKDVSFWPVWSKHGSRAEPVVIVPASYVDAVRALKSQSAEAISILENGTEYERIHVPSILRAALQQYREATGAEP